MADIDFGITGTAKSSYPTLLSVIGVVLIILVALFLFYGYAVYRKDGGDILRTPLFPSVYSGDVVNRSAADEPLVRPTPLPQDGAGHVASNEKKGWFAEVLGLFGKNNLVSPRPIPNTSVEVRIVTTSDAEGTPEVAAVETPKRFEGAILGIFPSDSYLTITLDGKTVETLYLVPETTIRRGDEALSVYDLHPGDVVAVSWRRGMVNGAAAAVIAVSVDVVSASPIPPAGT